MTDFRVLIPARYASSRLPGKLMLTVGDRPLLFYTHDAAVRSGASQVVVATDDARILEWCQSEQIDARMTSPDHVSGSDRLAELVDILALEDQDIVVNLQGDEPLMPPDVITKVADTLAASEHAVVATACARITNPEELHDPNAVKVVLDQSGHALYFSRAPIPWHREAFKNKPNELPADTPYYRHFGIYAYRCGFLRRMSQLPVAEAEQAESLEQLRVLENGGRIAVCRLSEAIPPGVDTEEDFQRLKQWMNIA